MSNYELKDVSKKDDCLVDVEFAPQKPEQKQSGPLDKYNLVFAILLIHGIGSLMPWNMFINAESYFRDYKLATPANITSLPTNTGSNENELASLRENFLYYIGIASQLPNVLFNGLNLLINIGSGNLKVRVNLTLSIQAIIFAITIALAIVDSSQWQKTFFYLTMLSVIVLNMASGIYQNCIFGLGARFPGRYTNAILIGSNFSGTFTSTINLLSIWLAPAAQEAAIYYFVTALFVIFVCLISYNLLPRNRFFRHFDQDTSQSHGPASQSNEDNSFKGELIKKWLVFLKCWPQCFNVFFVFYITLALFPAVLADVKQVDDKYFSHNYFTSFACFFIFNLFAMIGNLISSWTHWPGRERVWILIVARLLFIPFFLFCNFNPQKRHWPVLIENDLSYIIGNVLFALSSGYLSSLTMTFASSDLKPDEAPKAGMLAAFFLIFGIFCGVNSSYLLINVVNMGKK